MWLLFLFIFLLSRLYHILVYPPFMDEMIYIRWLNSIREAGDWLLPLKEFGWEPLGIWLAVLINQLINNPLLSLRLNSVFFGLLSMIFVYKLAGKTAALFYILSPFLLWHDRLGLRGDNLVILAGLMVFYGLGKKSPLWWGLGIAIGLFTKTTAAALPVVVILSYLWFRPKLKRSDFIAVGLVTLPVLFYWLTGTLGLVLNKQSTFVGEALVKNNLWQIGPWLYQYLTWPVLLLVVVGILVNYKNWLLWLNWLTPLLLLIFSAKILFPRYLLPLWPFLLIYAADGFNWLVKKLPRPLRILTLVFFAGQIWFSGQILKDPIVAPLPEIDRWQYITGWPSGYGVKDLVNYLKTDTPEILVVEDNDLIKTGVVYYWQENQMTITQTATSGAYFVANINEGAEGLLIKEFSRPNGRPLKLFKLK